MARNPGELFHGSSEVLTEILADWPAGAVGIDFGGIFAGCSKQVARAHGDIIHLVVSPKPLTDYELNYEIENAWATALQIAHGDEAIAEAIMTPECETPAGVEDDDGTFGWTLQAMRGQLAAQLGYTSVEMRDEHGTTWLCLPGCTLTLVD